MFLRGHGSQSHYKNNGSTVGGSNTYHSSGNLNQVQGDAIRNITGRFGAGRNNLFKYGNGVFTGVRVGSSGFGGGSGYSFGDMKFDASKVVSTSNENRPVNKAVRYLIRALP